MTQNMIEAQRTHPSARDDLFSILISPNDDFIWIVCSFSLRLCKNIPNIKNGIKFLKKKTFFDLPIDKREKKMYNNILHYNRLICLKMGRNCFVSAVFILILYENNVIKLLCKTRTKRMLKAKIL